MRRFCRARQRRASLRYCPVQSRGTMAKYVRCQFGFDPLWMKTKPTRNICGLSDDCQSPPPLGRSAFEGARWPSSRRASSFNRSRSLRNQRLEQEWPPRSERRLVNVAGNAIRLDGSKIRVRVLNISYEGCQLETERVMLVGERVKLSLPGLGEIPVEIRWVTKGRAGARFVVETPLLAEKR